MSWGVFEKEEEKEIHIAPCDEEGYLDNRYVLDRDYHTVERIEQEDDVAIIIHHAIQ